jgi:hypothetical protein
MSEIDVTPFEFLQSVYRDPHVPLPVRLRAAEAAAPFCHPKLSFNANINAGFASRLERAMEAIGKRAVIDAKPAIIETEAVAGVALTTE